MPARYKFHRLTADELSRDLDELGLSASQLCRMTGAQRRNVLRWLDPDDPLEIPHHINLLLMMWKLIPGTLAFAKTVADDHVIEEERDHARTDAD